MKTETKIYILTGLVTLIILVGGILFLSKENQKQELPLLGEAVHVQSRSHVPEGTKIEYNSNPPHSGSHYPRTAHAGIYEKAPEDGYLIHSLEHGAVILWYDEKLKSEDIKILRNIFDKMGGKTIMTPRKGMDVPVALTSWGRILKLEKIDEQKILEFYEANYNRGPENAPI